MPNFLIFISFQEAFDYTSKQSFWVNQDLCASNVIFCAEFENEVRIFRSSPQLQLFFFQLLARDSFFLYFLGVFFFLLCLLQKSVYLIG